MDRDDAAAAAAAARGLVREAAPEGEARAAVATAAAAAAAARRGTTNAAVDAAVAAARRRRADAAGDERRGGSSDDDGGGEVPHVVNQEEMEREMNRDMTAMRRSNLRSFYNERVRAYLRQRHFYFVDDNDEDNDDDDDDDDVGEDGAFGGAERRQRGVVSSAAGSDGSRDRGRAGVDAEDCAEAQRQDRRFPDDETEMPGPCNGSDARAWWLRDGQCQRLTLLAACASTTDHVSQSASNVLRNDENFWSSTGSADGHRDESLMIRLGGTLNRVRAIVIAPFRARFQFGEPVYPPRAISIEIGTSPNRMVRASPRYRVKKSEVSQLFLLWPSAPPGAYVRITLHGSLQQQLEDMRYYIAVRHVAVFGTTLDGMRIARAGFNTIKTRARAVGTSCVGGSSDV